MAQTTGIKGTTFSPFLADGHTLDTAGDSGSTDNAIEMAANFYNNTGGTLTAGTVVYLLLTTGYVANRGCTVAKSDGDAAAKPAQYIVYEDTENLTRGRLIEAGRLTVAGFDCSGATVGDAVYLSATAGGVTLSSGTPQVGVVAVAANPGTVYFNIPRYTSATGGGGAEVLWPDGTAALPGLAKATDTDTGFYGLAANSIGIALGGVAGLALATSAPTFTAATDTAGQDIYLQTAAGVGTGAAPRVGGSLFIKGGVGSTGLTTVAGGAGAAVSVSGGAGGAKTGTGAAAGGAGGSYLGAGGAGGATASTSTGNGGAGGSSGSSGGVGGAVTAGTGTGGTGGAVTNTAGAGGANTGAAAGGGGGTGGAASLVSGAGASTNSTAGGAGGAAGAVSVTGADGGSATGAGSTGAGGAGSTVTVTGGAGGTSVGGASGAGGSITGTAGAAGAVTTAGASSSNGGAITWTGGAGSSSSQAGVVAGTGGSFSGVAGAGGANSGGGTGGNGGNAVLTAGAGGSGLNTSGGSVVLTPGAPSGSGTRGSVSIAGPLRSPVTASQSIADNGTIALPTTGFNALVATSTAANKTGVILAAGIADGQTICVINTTAANTITFAAAGTSNVADGVAAVIPALRAMMFTWDATSSRWYRQGA